jgi:hypothetical protein
MLSVKGIFNGKTVELLEAVPYQKKVPVTIIFGEGELSPEQSAKHALMREYYLRQRIAEGATNEELQKLIADMDRIDREFETDPDRLRREAKQYADQKLREWCEEHGVAYNPADDLVISDFTNDAIKQVREENKRRGEGK